MKDLSNGVDVPEWDGSKVYRSATIKSILPTIAIQKVADPDHRRLRSQPTPITADPDVINLGPDVPEGSQQPPSRLCRDSVGYF